MKKEDVPQDHGALGKVTKEVCYVVDDQGKYVTGLSDGWEVKSKALDAAWNDIGLRVAEARKKLISGEASPVLFFMELRLMDIPIVAAYTRFWKWQVKQHTKPSVFKKLSDKKLQKYADLFEVSLEDFKNVKGNEAKF